MHRSGDRAVEPVRIKWIRSLTVGDSTLTRFCRVHAYLPRASRRPASKTCDGVLVCSSSVASRWAKPSAVNLTQRADFRRGDVLVKQTKQMRGAVGIQRRTDDRRRRRCDVRGSRHLHQQWGGARGNAKQGDELPLRVPAGRSGDIGCRVRHTVQQDAWGPPEGIRPPPAVFSALPVHHGRARAMQVGPLPTIVRTASHIGENLLESDARAVKGRLDLFQPCTEERESVHVEYV